MRDFRTFMAWQKAHALCLKICDLVLRFPADEKFGLTSMIRRTAMNIPMTLSHGCGSDNDTDFAKSCYSAIRQCSELEYQLILAKDLKYLPESIHSELETATIEVRKMTIAYAQKLRQTQHSSLTTHDS